MALQYEYTTNYSPPPHTFYPNTHHLSGVSTYDQAQVYDGAPLLLPAVDGTSAGYLNHYVGLHSSVRWLSRRRPSVAMEVVI